MRDRNILPSISSAQTHPRMDKFTIVLVLQVLGYTQARPYYYGYHVPWYPVSPCNPYPYTPCQAYSYPYPCGGQPAPPPRPTPCNPQPRGPPSQPPPAHNKHTEDEALLTQDLINVRQVRQGSRIPQVPTQHSKYNTNEYRALKQKPLRRNRLGNRRYYNEDEHYGGYGRGMAPAGYRDHAAAGYRDHAAAGYRDHAAAGYRDHAAAGYRDHAAAADDYGEEYEEYDRGMGQGVYRDEGDFGHDEEDDEDDY